MAAQQPVAAVGPLRGVVSRFISPVISRFISGEDGVDDQHGQLRGLLHQSGDFVRMARLAVARERSVGSPSSQAMDLYMSSTLPVDRET